MAELKLFANMDPSSRKTAVIAISAATLVGVGLVALGAAQLESYGWVMFVVLPVVCGALAAVIFSRGKAVPFGSVVWVSAISGLIAVLSLLVFGIEGLICIVMALPIVVPLYIVGGLIGWAIVRLLTNRLQQQLCMLVALVMTPFFMGMEGEIHSTSLRLVTSEVVINAAPDAVWREVVAFSPIAGPREWWFRAGIAYPTHAEIIGNGVGAVRYCHFSTGAFVEPITRWEKPWILAFDVREQPDPMVEISPWGVRPPHLDSAIRSEKGMFELIPLEDGRTKLVGRTWLRVHMMPEFYWGAIVDELIHRIHLRVLGHIKKGLEE